MPCRVDYETKEEADYREKYANDAIFKHEIDKLRRIMETESKRYRGLLDVANERLKMNDLERVAFDSFMSVMLCKAMDLIAGNDMMKYTTHEMEWWYNEHKFRDDFEGKQGVDGSSRPEILQKLEAINQKYTVK